MADPAATPAAPSFLPAPATTTEEHSLRDLAAISMGRSGGHRSVSGVIVLLVLAGVVTFAFPTITDVIGGLRQRHVTSQFDNPTFRTVYRHGKVDVGQGLTRLLIDNPRVRVNVLVVQGTTTDALRAGAGHYVDTPYPCRLGNVGIAGHRTTYGRPFNRIDQMRPGDRITLVTPLQRCVYRVVPAFGAHANPWVVAPTAAAVVGQAGVLGGGHWLTMTSCNPKGSNAQRIILRSELVSATSVRPATS
jgi:sortase A